MPVKNTNAPTDSPKLKRFWVSWYDYATSRNFPNTTFTFWVSGSGRDCQTLVAVIDAVDEEAVWKRVSRHFRRYEQRFIDEVAPDWKPNDRFPTKDLRT